MTKAEREHQAVLEHKCPRRRCWARPGHACIRPTVHISWHPTVLKHPHPERVALVECGEQKGSK